MNMLSVFVTLSSRYWIVFWNKTTIMNLTKVNKIEALGLLIVLSKKSYRSFTYVLKHGI